MIDCTCRMSQHTPTHAISGLLHFVFQRKRVLCRHAWAGFAATDCCATYIDVFVHTRAYGHRTCAGKRTVALPGETRWEQAHVGADEQHEPAASFRGRQQPVHLHIQDNRRRTEPGSCSWHIGHEHISEYHTCSHQNVVG